MIGRILSHYTILEKIGSGGMGDVYLADDTELDRKVALKVLPPEMADSADRRERFKREAKAVAALNHPNIVTVYSVEQADGVHFITMELVRGKTLTELLTRNGFPLGRFFDIAIPLADAVAAAHQEGITHRDLKPDNVMVNDEGRVKVLDFGLAKESPVLRREDSELPTRAMTQEGLIVGTPHYMSPEQAQGERVDARSDIFSLGTVLYLMTTGRHPFQGNTSTAVLSSILKDKPAPVTDVNPSLPGLLGRTIRRCLEKDPENRLQSAKDLRNELRESKQEMESGDVEPARASPTRNTKWILALAGAVVTSVVGTYLVLRGPRNERTETAGTAMTLTRLTSQAGQELFPSLSPDGNFVVYANDSTGNWDIYLQRVGGENALNLTEDSPTHDTQPSFSPDGNSIAFRSERDGGGIFLMGATGESVRRVTDVGCSPSWSPDGSEIAFATGCGVENPHSRSYASELWTVDVASGATRLVTDSDAVQPSWSPSGSRIAYWSIEEVAGQVRQRDIWTIPARGGERTRVTVDAATDWNPVWSPDGNHLYFSSDRGGSMNLWRVEIDPDSGTTLGSPENVTIGATASHQHHSFSSDGKRLVYVESIASGNLWKVPFDPSGKTIGQPFPITTGSRLASRVDVSPDGQELVFYDKGSGREDIFVIGTDGKGRRKILDDSHKNMFPRWRPDGKKIGFYSNRSGSWELWTIEPDGSGLQQLTDTPGEILTHVVWSPDGSRIAYNMLSARISCIVDANKPWSDQTPLVLPSLNDELRFSAHSWSPDGRSIAGAIIGEGGAHRPAIYDLDTERYFDSSKIVASLTSNEVEFPAWLPDSSGLVFVGGGASTGERGIFLTDREFRGVQEVLSSQDATSPRVSPDGQWIYFSRDTFEADLWLLTFNGR